MNAQEVLTVENVAKILKIHHSTIQRKEWRKRTGCPLRKKGKRLYATDKEFYAWLKEDNYE